MSIPAFPFLFSPALTRVDDGVRGDFRVLLVFHSSRSFRNSLDAKLAKRQLREAGVVLVFTSQNLISGDPTRKVEEGLLEMMDELRSDEQAMFVASGLRQKFERGLHNGTVPLGYERFRAVPGDPANGELRIVESEAQTVRRIFELYAGGKHSELEVALTLNAGTDDGGAPIHRTKRGTPFTEGGIGEMLSNRVYTGVIIWHPHSDHEEVRDGRHEALIDADLFERVQQIKRERTHWRGRRPVARPYPLTRRAFCHDCGTTVAGDTGGKNNYRRMRHGRTGLCHGWTSHAADRREGHLGEFFSTRGTLPTDWQKQVRSLVSKPTTVVDANVQQAKRLRLVLEQLRKQNMWGDLIDEQYLAERREIERQLAEIEPRGDMPTEMTDLKRAVELLQDLGRLWDPPGVSGETKKQFIEEAFERIEIDELGIKTVRFAENLLPLVAVATVGGNGAGDRIRTGDPLLGKHYPICAVLQTWEQREMLSSYLLLRSSVGWGLLELEP